MMPHVACEPAVVPPIGHHGGDEFLLALIVHLDDDDVAVVTNLPVISNWKGVKPPDVLADLDAVEEDHGAVVRRAEPDEDPMAGGVAQSKSRLYQRCLRRGEARAAVYSSRPGPEAVGGIEIVLDQIALGLRFFVGAETAIGLGLVAIVEVAGFVGIDDGAPRTVEADAVTRGGALSKLRRGAGRGITPRQNSAKRRRKEDIIGLQHT